jgi:2,4-dienoyl-CoA reductase-like NADH-dependent reductase (Old Yellow Enzyme family)
MNKVSVFEPTMIGAIQVSNHIAMAPLTRSRADKDGVELDDRALRDIGIGRYQIEAAVYGLITFSGHADEGMVTPAAAANQRERQQAPTMEAAPWS